MKKILSIFAFTLACLSVNSQCNGGGGGGQSVISTPVGNSLSIRGGSYDAMSNMNLNSALGNSFTLAQSYSSTKGSAFIANEAQEGKIILNDGSEIANVIMNIDLYADEVIVTNEDGEDYYLDQKMVKEISIPVNGKIITFRKINPDQPNKLYEVLYDDGDMAFFKERYVTRKEATKNGMKDTPAKFNQRANYYMSHGENSVAKVKLKKKDIFSGFDGGEVLAMKEYAKAEGIRFKDESDFVAVFNAVTK